MASCFPALFFDYWPSASLYQGWLGDQTVHVFGVSVEEREKWRATAPVSIYASSRNSDRRREMDKRTPIHTLRDTLETARLQAIQELASTDGTTPSISTETLRRVAFLQLALVAVREELAAHEVKIGGGGEKPLE